MKTLIESLAIFEKYIDKKYEQCPIGCSLGFLHVYAHPNNVSNEDKIRLYDLGFSANDDHFVCIAGMEMRDF